MKSYKVEKEIVYTVDTDTEEGLKIAEDIRYRLYDKYNSVMVYSNGLTQVRIVAKNE